jgi:hypothetical protein
MAFDPIQEDCHRLVLEALRRDNIPLTDGAAVERLMEQFTRNPAPLIVHDRDRAGHLIAKVVEAVDYRIPFIPDDAQAEQEEAAAENMLREAAALDPANWDAQRMLTALTAESNEEYVQYLVSKCDEVEHDLALKIASAQDSYEREAAGDLTRRPYLRWLAALASRALISGRYRMSLEAANRSLDFAPNDPAATPQCSPWQSSNTPLRSSSAFALPTPSPISPTRRCAVVPRMQNATWTRGRSSR